MAVKFTLYDLLPYEDGDDPDCLNEDVWYALVMNINQRQRKLEHYIYKRNVSKERNDSLA